MNTLPTGFNEINGPPTDKSKLNDRILFNALRRGVLNKNNLVCNSSPAVLRFVVRTVFFQTEKAYRNIKIKIIVSTLNI